MVDVRVVDGDLLDQPVDAIVNPWNRNLIPWWLLCPQGVSGAIKRRGGVAPFRELGRSGGMALGSAVVTSAGRLPFKGIVHVAALNLWWRSSEQAIRQATRNAVAIALERGWRSLALPLIGAGTGGVPVERALSVILDELSQQSGALDVTVVQYREAACRGRRGGGAASLAS